MLESKRKFKRFDLPLVVEFRPTYGATEYSSGMTKNISYQGLGLESHNFSFILYENLELRLKSPQSDTFVYLLGNVVWKKQLGDKNLAGIEFRMTDEDIHNSMVEKISSLVNLPVYGFLNNRDTDYKIKDQITEKTVQKKVGKREKNVRTSPYLGFTKQYLKRVSKCKVTFRLPKEAAPNAQRIMIVGDFNKWDTTKTPMKRLKSGNFMATLDLYSNREYRFRYLIDGTRWENDWQADKYVPNSFGSDDSVVIV
jgi:hypothetical protein